MISNYRAIFFDAGGTLLHPYPSVGSLYQKVAACHGLQVSAEAIEKKFRDIWRRRDGISDLRSHSSEKIEREWWRALVGEVFHEFGIIERFESFFDELYDLFAEPVSWRLYPGIIPLLKELKKRNKRLAIISNWDSRLFKLCEALGLNPYFEFVLASAVFGASKPAPEIFQEALKRMNLKPGEAVHVGDSLEDDVQGAVQAGMDAILIDHDLDQHDPRPHPFRNLKVIRHLSELVA